MSLSDIELGPYKMTFYRCFQEAFMIYRAQFGDDDKRTRRSSEFLKHLTEQVESERKTSHVTQTRGHANTWSRKHVVTQTCGHVRVTRGITSLT